MIVNNLVVPAIRADALNNAARDLSGGSQVNATQPGGTATQVDVSTPSGVENRFQSVIRDLATGSDAIIRARVTDTDSFDFSQMIKNQILQQAGISMLSQANATPQSVLAILGR